MTKYIFGLVLIVSSYTVSATIFDYTTGPEKFGGNRATYDSIHTSYNTNTHVLTWKTENAVKNGRQMDGFWLVLNDGPNNPKGDDGLAIFYAKFVDSDGPGTRDEIGLWAFEYNGKNNPNSYRTKDYLGNFSPHLINTDTTRGFSLDVSSIYSNLSTDAPFGEQIGIWFHPTWGSRAQTNSFDQLMSLSKKFSQGWYDTAGRETVVISEPNTLMLLFFAIISLAGVLRQNSRSRQSVHQHTT